MQKGRSHCGHSTQLRVDANNGWWVRFIFRSFNKIETPKCGSIDEAPQKNEHLSLADLQSWGMWQDMERARSIEKAIETRCTLQLRVRSCRWLPPQRSQPWRMAKRKPRYNAVHLTQSINQSCDKIKVTRVSRKMGKRFSHLFAFDTGKKNFIHI